MTAYLRERKQCAVTKSGTGTWDVGRRDVGKWDLGTRGRGDAGTRGRGDAGTRGRGDARTSELGDARGFEDVINKSVAPDFGAELVKYIF